MLSNGREPVRSARAVAPLHVSSSFCSLRFDYAARSASLHQGMIRCPNYQHRRPSDSLTGYRSVDCSISRPRTGAGRHDVAAAGPLDDHCVKLGLADLHEPPPGPALHFVSGSIGGTTDWTGGRHGHDSGRRPSQLRLSKATKRGPRENGVTSSGSNESCDSFPLATLDRVEQASFARVDLPPGLRGADAMGSARLRGGRGQPSLTSIVAGHFVLRVTDRVPTRHTLASSTVCPNPVRGPTIGSQRQPSCQ